MATIKRVETDGVTRIVTKVIDGVVKVSCTCCDEPAFCCMYPFLGYNNFYTFEDLPNELFVEGGFAVGENSNFTKLAAPEVNDIGVVIIYEAPSVNFPEPEDFNEKQFIGIYDGEWVTYAPFALDGAGECLIRSDENGDFLESWFIQDTFADTYTATCTTTIGGNTTTTTFTLYREGLCVWRARNEQGAVTNQLFYRTLAEGPNSGSVLWALDGTQRTDEGPYNSPAGTYGDCVVTEA